MEEIYSSESCTITRAVSCQLPTTEARVHSHDVNKVALSWVFLRVFRFSCVSIIPFCCNLCVIWGRSHGPVSGRISAGTKFYPVVTVKKCSSEAPIPPYGSTRRCKSEDNTDCALRSLTVTRNRLFQDPGRNCTVTTQR